MNQLVEMPNGPQDGDEVTVILILPDGQRLESKGIFESAEWETEVEDVSVRGDMVRKYIPVDRSLTLRLRRVGTLRVAALVDAGGVER